MQCKSRGQVVNQFMSFNMNGTYVYAQEEAEQSDTSIPPPLCVPTEEVRIHCFDCQCGSSQHHNCTSLFQTQQEWVNSMIDFEFESVDSADLPEPEPSDLADLETYKVWSQWSQYFCFYVLD